MSVIEVGTSTRTPQHLPIGSLKGYGTNLYGEPIWRVVWSESRHYMVGGNHIDYDGDPSKDSTVEARGKDPNAYRVTAEYRWLPLYPNVHGWVLERWMSPQAFTGCTKEVWDITHRDSVTNLLTLGPFPDRGEYVQCFTFPAEPTFSQVVNRINLTKAGWNHTYAEHKAANDDFVALQEKARTDKFKDIFRDSQQAFNNKASSIRPGKRTKEKIPFRNIKPQIHDKGFSTQLGDQQCQVRSRNVSKPKPKLSRGTKKTYSSSHLSYS